MPRTFRPSAGTQPSQGRSLRFPLEERNFSTVGNFLFQSWNDFGKFTFRMEATEPHTHQDEESVNLARARLTLCAVLALYSLDHIGDLPGEGSQTLLRIV